MKTARRPSSGGVIFSTDDPHQGTVMVARESTWSAAPFCVCGDPCYYQVFT